MRPKQERLKFILWIVMFFNGWTVYIMEKSNRLHLSGKPIFFPQFKSWRNQHYGGSKATIVAHIEWGKDEKITEKKERLTVE